jgi:hypothetical protein
MDSQIRYRVCEERNVAAAFERFRLRRHPLRTAAVLLSDQLLSSTWRNLRRLTAAHISARKH